MLDHLFAQLKAEIFVCVVLGVVAGIGLWHILRFVGDLLWDLLKLLGVLVLGMFVGLFKVGVWSYRKLFRPDPAPVKEGLKKQETT